MYSTALTLLRPTTAQSPPLAISNSIATLKMTDLALRIFRIYMPKYLCRVFLY